MFTAVTFNDNSFIVGIKRVPESENDNRSIFGNIIVYLHIDICHCLSLRVYISLDFIRLYQTLMPMTLVIDSYIISTTSNLNALLFLSDRYSKDPKILHWILSLFKYSYSPLLSCLSSIKVTYQHYWVCDMMLCVYAIKTFILYWQVNCDFPSWNGIIHGSSCSIPCNTATEIKQCLSAENLNSTEINQH